jgi:hypothetical protein
MSPIPRADTGNFNRLLTSVGLALVAAALVVPFFFFRDTATLNITRVELNALTATGRDAFVRRQHRIADIEIPVIIFSGCLLLGGGISLFFGGKRLWLAQQKEDAAIDRQAQRDAYEILKQSEGDIDRSRSEQAERVMTEQQIAKAVAEDLGDWSGSGTKAQSPTSSTDEAPPAYLTMRDNMASLRRELGDFEDRVQAVMSEAVYRRYRFSREVQIVPNGRHGIALDGLFQARDPGLPDVALELKLSAGPLGGFASRSTAYVDQLISRLSQYKDVTGKEALGWLLVVLKEGSDPRPAKVREVQQRINDLLGEYGRCTFLSEAELDDAPNRFRRNFEPPAT